MLYPPPFQVGDSVIITAEEEQKGTIVGGNVNSRFMVTALGEDSRDVEIGERACLASELRHDNKPNKYIIYEHQGGADIGVTSFILHSTVAMIVFDLLSVTATLAYETPISRDAVVSTIFSLGAGFYGMLGKYAYPCLKAIYIRLM